MPSSNGIKLPARVSSGIGRRHFSSFRAVFSRCFGNFLPGKTRWGGKNVIASMPNKSSNRRNGSTNSLRKKIFGLVMVADFQTEYFYSRVGGKSRAVQVVSFSALF
ncbi:hypothetical protein CDAR_76601 [Caerostris darwini]|uniref:Ribosomal protein L2 n=1 Tax=Caerostris darwini TaxID=1538125 RepID=A0AAV4QCJ4_9ARAC|nr:hypothetical protein CDAR_76601 [Caerostris darwini]